MRKFNFLFCLFFITFLFISCEHSLESKPANNHENTNYTLVKGFLTDKFSGAAPENFQNLDQSSNSDARNAIPEITINTLVYEIYACQYDSMNGTEDTSTKVDVPSNKINLTTMTFEIELPDAVWKIHAKGSDSSGNLLVEGSSVITINSFESSGNGNDTDQTINISLHLAQSATGTGTVNLPFTFESGSLINYIEATWKDLDGDSHTKTMLPSSFIFDMNGDDHWGDSEIPSGVYKVTFRFYNSLGSTSCLYVIPEEEIMVLPGQTTSKWINNANSQYISDSGSFSITNEMIRAAHKNVYVEAKNDASDETADPDPDSTGSRYEPFSSIRKAFDYLAAIDGDHPESIEHQIIVSGEISVTQKYDSSKVYYFPVTNQKLTIKGLNSSTPGTIKCALDNNNDPITPGCAFFVAEDAILELGENLTVSHFVNNTNGGFDASSVEGNGGAVYIGAGGQLILNSCKIKNCKASCGSAIFLYSAEDIIFSGRPQVDGYTYFDGSGSFYLENDFDTTSNNNKYYVSFNIDEDHLNTYKIISKDSALSSYDYNTNFEVCGYSGVHFPGYFPINENGEIIGSIPTPQVTASMPSTIYVGTNILDANNTASRFISLLTSGMGECDAIVDVSYTWKINGENLLNSAMSASPFAYNTVDFGVGETNAQVELRNDFGQLENYEWSIKCDSKYNSLGTNYQSGTLGTVAIVDGEGTPVSILQKSNASTKNIIYSDFIGTDIVQTCINQANSQTGLSWRLPTVAEAVSLSFACNFDYDIIWLEGGYVIDIASGYFFEGDTYDTPDFAPSIRLIADVSSTPPVTPGDTVYTTWDDLCAAVAAANGADAAFYVDGALVAYSTLESMGKVTLIPYGSTCTIRRNYSTKDIVFNCSELVLQGSEDHKFILDGNNVPDSNSFINVGNDCAANLNYVTMKNCKSNVKGAAIYSTGTVNLENCDFNNNSSTSDGGAVYVKKNLTVNTCTFTENTSSSAGGAIASESSDTTSIVNILNSTFTKNKATSSTIINGGAIYVYSGTVTISDSQFIQNEAEGEGAAIAFFSSPAVTLKNLELSGNIKAGSSEIEGIYANVTTKMTLQGNNTIPYLKFDVASNSTGYTPIKLDSSFSQESSVCLAFTLYFADTKVLSSSNPNLAGSISIYNSGYEVYYDSSVSGYKLKTAAPVTSLDNIDTSTFTGFVEGNTYSIGTEQGLKNFATITNSTGSNNAKFKLTSNIELTESWSPIVGTANNGFLGIFDGNNKTISGLNIEQNTDAPAGLFGKVGTNAVIKNLTIKGSVTGTVKTGAIAGEASASGIQIVNCINYASIKGTSNVGGLIGSLNESTSIIKNCINFGDVTIDGTSNNTAGGIVGFMQGTVENCANLGNIKASDFVGGIIGSTANDDTVTIKNSYNAGKITVTGGGPSKYGAICGHKPRVMSNVWYEQNSCTKNNAVWGGGARTDTELHEFYYRNTTDASVNTLLDLADSLDNNASSTVGYNRWQGTYNAYPVFSGNYGSFNEELTTIVYANTLYTSPDTIDKIPSSGTKCAVGSQNDLIYINTLLNSGRTTLEGVTFVVLTEDIVLTNWTPIGYTGAETGNHGFRGIFDGNGCTITINGINGSAVTEDYGLFGYIQDAEIRNLTVKGNYQLSSKSNVGGIVGRVCVTSDKKVIIENCNSYVSITDPYSQGSNYGGIVGKVDNYAGTEDFIIRNCNNYGNISCKTSAGGILGYSSFKVVINNCMNKGKISIQDVESGASGGIVGKIDNDDYASIENNVNTGEIVSGSSIVGACPFISSKSFTNNFYLNQTGLNVIGNNTSYNDCYSIEKSGNTYVLVAGQDLEGDVLSLLIDNAHNNGWAEWTTDTSGNLMVAN